MNFPAIMVTKDLDGKIEVLVEVGGHWITVIEDSQTIVSHIVEGKTIQRLVAERIANDRKATLSV